MSVSIIKIRKPNDFHHHLRDGEMLKITVPNCFKKFKNVVVMPNLIPPIISIDQALKYRKLILKYDNYDGNPLMTLYLHKNIKIDDLINFKKHKEMIGIKFYPKNATTNSTHGTDKIENMSKILQIMEKYNIPLLIHGESTKYNDTLKRVDVFKREKVFIETELKNIIKKYPKLRIVLEHISTKHAVDFVLKHNIYATITPQHLILDRNDIFEGGIRPHHYCLPILKKSKDKEALVLAAISGNKKFFLGTDNAPHSIDKKENHCGCAGIFNSPVAVEIVTELFEKRGALDKLEKFISLNGCDFYGLPYNENYITLVKELWTVPENIDKLIPLYCGQKLKWKIQ